MPTDTRAALEPCLLLAELEGTGFTVAAAAGKLTVAPASKLRPDQRAMIQRYRDDLLVILAERPAVGKAVAPAVPRRLGWVLTWT